MQRKLALVLILFSSLVLANDSIVGKKWYLTSMNSVPVELMKFKDEKPFLQLMDENRYAAYAGCNRIMGGYEIEDDKIKFSGGAMTMMACQYNMEFEQKFVKNLEEVRTWSSEGEGHTLNLKSADLKILFVFDDTLPEPLKYGAEEYATDVN